MWAPPPVSASGAIALGDRNTTVTAPGRNGATVSAVEMCESRRRLGEGRVTAADLQPGRAANSGAGEQADGSIEVRPRAHLPTN
jgi:hypothetical protein